MKARKTAIEIGLERSIKAPCAECKRRFVGCHSDCTDYGSYKKRLSIARQDQMQRNKGDIMIDLYKDDNRKKYRKKEKEKK